MVSLGSLGSGERAGLPSPLPEFKPMTLEDAQRALIERGIPPQSSDSVESHLSDLVFRNRLEKHVDEYEAGRDYRLRGVRAELSRRHAQTGSALNESDPVSGAAYSSYSTSFAYSEKSRFKAGIYEATEKMQALHTALSTAGKDRSIEVTA